ncbi:hypothetical protein TNIN_321441 [Trichonephila inaurata madagascariensis]|uniref:Uncharacterized protein n=1 Tax=Trichonephila inaurata madagascariensis TaxID=2747483 RepID=A0A8X6YHD0_9ARAC|nr:hypothetical protein TNIN_321441 [Trichonephila inaurata madagascariensis]
MDALKASGIYNPENPYVRELLYELTDLHHQASLQINLVFYLRKRQKNPTPELASTTNQNIVIAPPFTENLLNDPTPNSNAPKPN